MMKPPEPEISAQAFAFLTELVYRRSRIHLGPEKRAFVTGRLAGRVRELGCGGFDDYCTLLETAGQEEAERLVDLVSTNHTHFFREPEHFSLLASAVLPQATDRATAAGRGLQVWCAAAASGEEAYSLAIVLAEHARAHAGLGWVVYASDISRRMLDRCRLGIYEADRVKLPQPAWLARYFRRGFGEREGFYRVRPEYRRHVQVETINLFETSYPLPRDQDVIFCRNAMIYFDDASRQTLLDRLYEQLAAGGHLFVGHAESLLGLRHRFRQIGPAVYQKPA